MANRWPQWRRAARKPTRRRRAAKLDPIAALRPEAPLVHPDLPTYAGYAASMGGNVCTVLDSARGDVDKAFAEADAVFEDTFRSQGINQGYLEPMACVANIDPSGRINVWTSTQGPYQVRASLADVLQRPMSRIRVIPMELGGGFGAKLRLCLEPYPVLLAESDGLLVAAVSTATGELVSDPFVAAADVVALLQLRARQLDSAA